MVQTKDKKTNVVEAEFTLTISDDKMQVLFSCEPEFAENDRALEILTARLEGMKTIGQPDLEAVKAGLREYSSSGQTPTNIPIITGRPAVPPVNGILDWTDDFFIAGYRIDPENKRINFQEKSEESMVEKRQLLAKVTPGIPGRNGLNVLGKAIKVPLPREINLKSGPNVIWDEEVGGFRAGCSGRVRLTGKVLDVDHILRLNDGVGADTGNIHHNGKVIISGDIEVNFSVEATGDIDASGVVYASNLKAGGNLTAPGGINGDDTHKITVAGDLLAKYIMNAGIDSKGNILVNSEIVQSKINTIGEVNCHEGRIFGGIISATKGITVGEAGAGQDTPTLLVAGVNRDLQVKLKSNSKEIKRVKGMIKKLDEVQRHLTRNIQTLDHGQREKLTEIQFKMMEGEEEVTRLEADNKVVYARIIENSSAKIRILKLLHPGVTLRISDQQYVVEHALVGPIVASLDRAKHEIVLSSQPDE
ncbi:MAG: DUF342 domain-containing protein [FCB group bacterium]|nr:DUF342 domain-containing protein [FCB group bacterium]